jgi:hypothetical protein
MAALKKKPEAEPVRMNAGPSDASVVAQLAALRKMSVVELKQRWEAPLRLLRVDAHFVSTGERTVTNRARPRKS